MTGQNLGIGIDVGTSGTRAIAMDETFAVVAQSSVAMADFGANLYAPATWWNAVQAALDGLLEKIERNRVRALAVDGTSGTVLPVDEAGAALSRALMYKDSVEDPAIHNAIAKHAPPTSTAHGATSGLAKAIRLQDAPGVQRILHQADWIAAHFSGRIDVSDENYALKTGYDPILRQWPDWIAETGLKIELLPAAVAPGTPVGQITAQAAERFDLPRDVIIVTGRPMADSNGRRNTLK